MNGLECKKGIKANGIYGVKVFETIVDDFKPFSHTLLVSVVVPSPFKIHAILLNFIKINFFVSQQLFYSVHFCT
jgi:hypothetical protein